MAWVVSNDVTNSAATASFAVTEPAHLADDVLFYVITQDGGATTIATTDADWTFLAGQTAASGSRTVVAWKVGTGTPATSTFTGSNDEWVFSKIVVRDADTTAPVGSDFARASWSGATGTNPALTTTSDKTTVLYIFGTDRAFDMEVNNEDSVYIGYDLAVTGASHHISWKYQATQAAIPTVTVTHSTGNEGGSAWVVAIKNAAGGGVKAESIIEYNAVREYGSFHPANFLNTLSSVTSTIGGVTTDTTLEGLNTNAEYSTYITNLASVVTGAVDKLDSTIDVSGKLLSFAWRYLGDTVSGRIAGVGVIFGVVDTLGNWAAYQVRAVPEAEGVWYHHYVDIENETAHDESGTAPDLTDIDQVFYGIERGASTSSTGLLFKNLCLDPKLILVGGNSARPASPRDWDALERGGYVLQGSNQVVSGENLQYGNGTIETYVDLSASAVDAYAEDSYFNYEGAVALINRTIYASANCTMNFTNCVIASTVKTNFTIHASSNLSATYSFAGMNLSRHVVTWLTGVACNKANFNQCYKIDAKAATFTNCLVSNSLDTVALTHTAAATITAMEFISGGTGHAIELTTAGDYTHTGVTYSGYAGSDGSTGNEAILVSASSGIVNITIGSADETPTIMTAGATVNLVQPQTATTIAVNVTGAEITILDTGTQTEQYHVETGGATQDFDFTAPIGNNVDILVFKPGYRQFVLLDHDLGSADSMITANLVAVPSYA